jgi:hypothetical protein
VGGDEAFGRVQKRELGGMDFFRHDSRKVIQTFV